MSLVIAAKIDGSVLMGADSQTSHGDREKVTGRGENNLKITKMPRGILLGHVGEVRVIQPLACHGDWFEETEDEPLSKRFLVEKIVPRYYEELKKRGWLANSDDPSEHTCFRGSFLIAQGDRLFGLNGNFSVDEIPAFAAIGCGQDAAYLAWREADADAGMAQNMLLRALRLSVASDNSVGAPFVFIDTKELRYEYVEE